MERAGTVFPGKSRVSANEPRRVLGSAVVCFLQERVHLLGPLHLYDMNTDNIESLVW